MKWSVGEEPMVRIRREVVGSVVDSEGYPVAATEVELDFVGTRDSVPYQTMILLPEGERASASLIILTETPLRAGEEETGVLPDRVRLDGLVWEVRDAQKYPRVIPHYEARIMRIKA